MNMQYPLIPRHLLEDLRLVHGLYNASIMLLFVYQGRLGLAIRRARLAHKPLPVPLLRRHRRLGPVFFVLGVAGFLAGLTLVLLDTGDILEYPPHFLTGLALVVLLAATFALSRRIRGPGSPYRAPHFYLGIAIVCLYVVEVVLGLGVLL